MKKGSVYHDKLITKMIDNKSNVYVNYSMNILDRINFLLKEKFNGDLILVAERLQKTENEVYLIFNGVQNYDLYTISQLEVLFGEKIIQVL